MFCAAEHMLSARDYTTAMVMDFGTRHMAEIANLSRGLQDALIDALSPQERVVAPQAPAAQAAPINDEDIPF